MLLLGPNNNKLQWKPLQKGGGRWLMPLAVSLKHTCDCFVSKFSCLHAVGHAVWHQSNSEEVY